MRLSKEDAPLLAEFFKSFSTETRIEILYLLLAQKLDVSTIASTLKLDQSLVSHQLKALKLAKLVKSEKDKQHVYYSLLDSHVKDIITVGLEHVKEER
ncbi:MAG: metalloregulator ArsR/SmtB family transcription factor [Acholeplasmatales bacterium]|jgi:ArsR family transcriptional regulator|nr:metalloregulator ArsR/SmtB family transcription factor [Acholeplasmatales bacterium]